MSLGTIALATAVTQLLIQWIFTALAIAPKLLTPALTLALTPAPQTLWPILQTVLVFVLFLVLCSFLLFWLALESRSRLPQATAQTQAVLKALALEQEKSEQLLLNILPASIAQELKQKPRPIAHGYDEVTVMFADIVSFTPMSARMSPQKLVHLLNLIFSAFDQLTEQHCLEKIKTIGDAYMVAGGLPETAPHHADAMVELALAMQRAIAQISHETGEDLQLRIGIHTGPVVAGVIGLKKFSYDLWGDTVNIASRMESQGRAGGIQISESTRKLLTQDAGVRSLGLTAIKGKGEMRTYEVEAF